MMSEQPNAPAPTERSAALAPVSQTVLAPGIIMALGGLVPHATALCRIRIATVQPRRQ